MMPVRSRTRVRVLRGLVAASACTVLAHWGHNDAGGARPTGMMLALLALPLAALMISLADRRRGPVTIFVLVGGSQLLLHELLQLLGSPANPHAVTDAGMAGMPGMPGPPAAMNPLLMTGAHALATLVTAAILSGAEEAALAMAVALVDVVLAAPSVTRPCPAEPGTGLPVSVVPLTGRLRGVLARRLNLRRGPPIAAPG